MALNNLYFLPEANAGCVNKKARKKCIVYELFSKRTGKKRSYLSHLNQQTSQNILHFWKHVESKFSFFSLLHKLKTDLIKDKITRFATGK